MGFYDDIGSLKDMYKQTFKEKWIWWIAQEVWEAAVEWGKWIADATQSVAKWLVKWAALTADFWADIVEGATDIVTWLWAWALSRLTGEEFEGTQLLTGEWFSDRLLKDINEGLDNIDMIDSLADDTEFWKKLLWFTEWVATFITPWGLFSKAGKLWSARKAITLQKEANKLNLLLIKLKKAYTWTAPQKKQLITLIKKISEKTTKLKDLVKKWDIVIKGSALGGKIKTGAVVTKEGLKKAAWIKDKVEKIAKPSVIKKLMDKVVKTKDWISGVAQKNPKKIMAALVAIWLTSEEAKEQIAKYSKDTKPESKESTQVETTETESTADQVSDKIDEKEAKQIQRYNTATRKQWMIWPIQDSNEKLDWQVWGFDVWYNTNNLDVWLDDGTEVHILEEGIDNMDTAQWLSPADYENDIYAKSN